MSKTAVKKNHSAKAENKKGSAKAVKNKKGSAKAVTDTEGSAKAVTDKENSTRAVIKTEDLPKTVIKAEHLSKTYDIFLNNGQKIRSLLFRKPSGNQKLALKDLNLTINKGERVAILGNVGSGRSTLMKLLSGIIHQTSGNLEVNEEVTKIFDLRTGFDGALNGYDNMYIRGAYIGLTRSQIKEKEQEIVAFSGLGDIMHLPLKSWKAGCASILSVSIYLAFKPEILLIDDSLAVRDKVFKQKMMARFEELLSDGETTLVIVSNQIPFVKKLCNRAIILNEGEILFDGDSAAALKEYKKYAKKQNMELMERESDLDDEDDDDDYDEF